MSKVFYNLEFIDELDMITWCELYKTTKGIFDTVEMDEDGGYHVTFSADDVPKYHKEVCKEVRAEMEAINGERRNGTAKRRPFKGHGNKAKAGRGQTANELFLLR